MPIAKGEEWGTTGLLPNDAPIVQSDRAAASHIAGPDATIGLEAGDLARTLGVRPPLQRQGTKQLLPIDGIAVELDDGSTHWCVAHTQLGHRFASGQFIAIMNAAFIGTRNIAPRAHPGDGLADVVTMELRPADRVKAWRRMSTASHVPHPSISIRRRATGTITLARPTVVRIDGQRVGRTTRLTYTVKTNMLTVAVS